MTKNCFCSYDNKLAHADGSEALHISIPSGTAYVDYIFQHSIDMKIKADNWRIGEAVLIEKETSVSLTERGEWEFAVWVRDHGLSGGILHGYEITDRLEIFIDGKKACMKDAHETPFTELVIREDSIVYDCVYNEEAIGVHQRKYVFSENGLELFQDFTWNGSYDLDRCYMAMFPISKRSAKTIRIDDSPEEIDLASCGCCNTVGPEKITTKSPDGKIYGGFQIKEHPCGYEKCREFFISDNGGRPYYKMYFRVCRQGHVEKDDTWHTDTRYSFTIN